VVKEIGGGGIILRLEKYVNVQENYIDNKKVINKLLKRGE
jgi:hypothetical protein